jgi:DNA invertase Pin-like site-specific DNA recombinase
MARKTPKGDPKLAVAYLRVSTEDQRLGPEAQRMAIEQWAAREDVQISSWHTDNGISGGAALDKRPALLAALDALKQAEAGLLIVAKRDRLARDVMVAAMVERLAERGGARIVSADGMGNIEGPEGQLMRGMVDLFAQYERALIRARTRAALGVKKSRGERVGQIPYGKRLEGDRLVDDLEECSVIQEVLRRRSEGQSAKTIAKALNDQGTPARGSRWHPTTIIRILANNDGALVGKLPGGSRRP